MVLVNYGPDNGKLATIIDVVDQNKVRYHVCVYISSCCAYEPWRLEEEGGMGWPMAERGAWRAGMRREEGERDERGAGLRWEMAGLRKSYADHGRMAVVLSVAALLVRGGRLWWTAPPSTRA